ncbi:MAG: agmatinase [Thermoplasmata archaeon]|nr:MAG: agmatinase [Thermoplasmata archaeon]RLF92400.1 MAG: agmatinase [Thermococci archaeon]
MNSQVFFADAESNLENAEYVIFGVPYDKTSSFRHGASRAPKEIRNASWNFETFNMRTQVDLRDIKIHDYGDIDVKNDKPEIMISKVRKLVSMLLSKNKFPIAVGGEHSITPGIIQAFPRDIAVLSLDAHIDFREKYDNQSYNHACVIRRISEHIPIGNIVLIGVRSADREEFQEMKKQNLFYIDSFEIKNKGIKQVLSKTKEYLRDKQIYLTLDIDVLDPAYAPGTSTPEPFGLTTFDILEIIDFFSPSLVGFDIVEVCPNYDNGETALLAAKLIRQTIEQNWFKKHG